MLHLIRSNEQDYHTNCLLIYSVHCTNAIGMGEKCSLLHNRYYLRSAWMDSSQIFTSNRRHPTTRISIKKNCLRYLLLMKFEIYQLDHFFWGHPVQMTDLSESGWEPGGRGYSQIEGIRDVPSKSVVFSAGILRHGFHFVNNYLRVLNFNLFFEQEKS